MAALDAIGPELHAALGVAATYQASAGDTPLAVSARVNNATQTATRTRRAARDALGVGIHLLVSEVATRPPRGARVVIASGAFAGAWLLLAAAEPSNSGEWHALATRDTTEATLAQSGGDRRQRITP